MIQKQTITAQFKAGVNVGDDPKVVQQELLKCENGYFDRMGSISKRNGYAACSGTTYNILAKHDDKVVSIGGTNLVRRGTNGTFYQASNEIVFSDIAIESICGEKSNLFLYPTVEVIGNFLVVAYTNFKATDSLYYPTVVTYSSITGVKYQATELETGASAVSNCVRLVNDGTDVYAIYVKSTGYLALHKITGTTGGISSSSTNISSSGDVAAIRAFDATFLDDATNRYLVAYANTSGDLKIHAMCGATSESSDTVVGTSIANVGAWTYSTTKGMILYYDYGPEVLKIIGYDGDMTNTVAATTIESGFTHGTVHPINMTGIDHGSGFGRIYATIFDSTTGGNLIKSWTFTFSTLAVGTATTFGFNATITSRPFLLNGIYYLIVNHQPRMASGIAAQSTYFLMSEAGATAGKFLVGRSGPSDTPDLYDNASISNVVTSGTTFIVGALERTSMTLNPWVPAVGYSSLLHTDTGFVKATISGDLPAIQCVEQNGVLLIPNSCPWMFDGQEVVEQGFLQYPEGLTATQTTSGSLTLLGTYGYRAVYEWLDAKGNLHQSAASPVTTVTLTGSNQTATISVPPLSNTRKENVQVVLYRTVNLGDIYYKLASKPNVKYGGNISFTDTSADSALSSKPMLYTVGNIADNIQPHPYKLHCIHQDRHFYVSSEYPETRIYYSKHIIPGEAVPHTDVFYIEVAADGGDIKAIVSYMGQLLIFKENRILASSGDGYTDDSQGNNYTPPFEISRDVGCTNHKGLVKIDKGVVFPTNREICLLDQTFRISRIGERVRYLTDTLTMKAAVVDSSKGYIVFFTTGSAIVYSYVFDQWSTFTNRVAIDAIECAGTLYWRNSTADATYAESTAYQDVAASIIMTIETGWISLADLGGAFRVDRVWPIGQNISGHTLNIQTAVDLIPYWDTAQAFNATALGSAHDYTAHYTGLASTYKDKEYMTEVRMRQPKCHSVRFKIYDSETAAAVINEGYSLTALAMRVGIRRGPLQVGSGRQV